MPKLKVSLSIGLSNATRHATIDIDNDEWTDCETDEDRNMLIEECATEWANQYIDIGAMIVD